MEDLSFVLYMQRKFNFLHSIPGIFVPHSTSNTNTTSKRPTAPPGLPLPPFDNTNYSHSQLTLRSIDQFLSPRVGAPDPWRPISNTPTPTIAGMKRPPEPTSQSLNLTYLNGFDCRPDSSPSPPKALNTGHTSPQGATSPTTLPTLPTLPTLLPSMSSLQALLSKLPSVTHPLDAESNIHGIPSTGFTSNRPPISRSVSKPASKEEISNGKRMVKGEAMDCGSTSDVGDVETVENPPRCSNVADHAHESTIFLESFENLNEYGIPEALENGDSSYSSFLNEICS